MTVTFGFYNSVNGDRKYDAEDFSEIFDGIIEDGVHKGIGDDFKVTATGGNTVAVGTGRAWFDHTWTKSDTAVPFTIDAAHASLNRIDLIVLEVDESDAVRANTIRYLRGTPAATPVAPGLGNTDTLHRYPLASIYRPLNAASITQANITNLVGTAATPYAVSRLLDRAVQPASIRRNVFRGKFLGTAYTAKQQAAVQSGSFEDLYLGDYWTINGVNWRIVDFDYYYNYGAVRCVQHHIVLMPDTILRTGAMNEDFFKANAGAYLGSDMKKLHMPAMFNTVVAAFTQARILAFNEFFSNSMKSGPEGAIVNSGVWQEARVELPSQHMLFGTAAMMPGSTGANSASQIILPASNQFALFRLCPWFLPVGALAPASGTDSKLTQWTRDALSPTNWSVVTSMGSLGQAVSNVKTYGFRPYFCLI